MLSTASRPNNSKLRSIPHGYYYYHMIPLEQALYKWMTESGPIYLLPTGPVSSFLVISDPAAAKHVLR